MDMKKIYLTILDYETNKIQCHILLVPKDMEYVIDDIECFVGTHYNDNSCEFFYSENKPELIVHDEMVLPMNKSLYRNYTTCQS